MIIGAIIPDWSARPDMFLGDQQLAPVVDKAARTTCANDTGKTGQVYTVSASALQIRSIFLQQRLRDRSRLSGADDLIVDLDHGHHFAAGTGDESFDHPIEIAHLDGPIIDRDDSGCCLQHDAARDAFQHTFARRAQHAVRHRIEVAGNAFQNLAGAIDHQQFVNAGIERRFAFAR